MREKIAIHETAFVTSAFRASDENLSKDIYAKLWPTAKTQEHAQRYSNSVSKYEPFAHCLRNRFFLDTINKLISANKIEVLINFGCGFSMYPFLLDENLIHVEIDKPDVIDYKKQEIASLLKDGTLPHREIHYISTDFNHDTETALLSEIKRIKKERTSFILLEGVLFFIGRNDSERLFALFNKIQGPHEFVGSVSFRKSLVKAKVFKKIIHFIESNLDKNEQFDYQTVDNEFYENLKNYKLVDHQDTLKLAKSYAADAQVESDKILNEHMYVLEKE